LQEEKGIMKNNKLFVQIRNKKIGILLTDARISKNITISDLSIQTGIPQEKLESFETGDSSPSLPELEVLAYTFNIPLEHFWGKQVLQSSENEDIAEKFRQLLTLRNKIIGANLQAKRQENDISIGDLAIKSEISEEELSSYENGELEIPIPILEILAKNLNCRIEDFFDNQGKIGNWRKEKEEIKNLMELPQNFREFITKPVNAPYLDLAIKLSEMDVNKLRLVAEGLLEITL
jgi:transcriptional regulator with XRE-family HTH domain